MAKEIQLKHRAPVVGIGIVDATGMPLDFPGSGVAPHRVLIASEEQFKVFSLPQLKPVTKYKLTAHEGARVRRMSFGVFSCRAINEPNQSSPSKSHKPVVPMSTPTDNEAGAGDTVGKVSLNVNNLRSFLNFVIHL